MKLTSFIERHYGKIAFIIYIIFYFIYIITRFTPNCLQHPIIQIDYTWHFVDMVTASHFFEEDNRIWGYNPYHSAGTTVGIVLAISNHWALLFSILLGRLFAPALIFNLSILIGLLLLPILAIFTAQNFEFKKPNSLLFFVLSIFFLRGHHMPTSFLYYGLYGFVLGTFLSLFTASLFFRYMHYKTRKNLVLLTFFASLTFFVHPLSFIICLLLFGPLGIFHFRQFRITDWCKLLCSASIVFLVNLIWIIPQIRFADYLEGTWHFFQSDAQFATSMLTDPHFSIIVVLFLFSLINLIQKERAFAASIFSSFVLLAILSFFGTQIGFSDLEPGRFAVPLILLALLNIAKIFDFERINHGLLLLMLVVLVMFATPQFELTCAYPDEAYQLLDFIKTNTSENSRIHVEDGVSQYFNSHFTSYIPYATSRQVLAAEYLYPTEAFMFPQFIDDTIFGKNLNNISDSEFASYLELYNVRYFLVYSKKAHERFDARKNFKKMFSVNDLTDKTDPDTFSLYEYMDANESFCYKCDADVHADYDIIQVANATSNVTILKYHYYDTLKIAPETIKIKAINLLDDPIPFILVENRNYTNFTIFNQ